MKYSLDEDEFNEDRLNSLLTELKSQFKNSIGNYEIIHMVINRFLADGKIYHQFADINNFDKIYLEIKFICLNKDNIRDLKSILSKYEIVVRNIVSLKYINEFEDFNDNNDLIIARRVLNGLNNNEIFFSNKIRKNVSFFEKFFGFFN